MGRSQSATSRRVGRDDPRHGHRPGSETAQGRRPRPASVATQGRRHMEPDRATSRKRIDDIGRLRKHLKDRGESMLAMTDKGNMETVRDALSGITGVKLSPDRDEGSDWFMVVVRANYHLDAVDGL